MENEETVKPIQSENNIKNNRLKKILIVTITIIVILVFFLVMTYMNGSQIINR